MRINKRNEDKPDRLPGTSHYSGLPDPHQPPRANKGPSIIAEGQRQKRTVTKSERPKPKPPTKTVVPTPPKQDTPKDTSQSGRGGTDVKETSAAQQLSDGPAPSIGSVHITVRALCVHSRCCTHGRSASARFSEGYCFVRVACVDVVFQIRYGRWDTLIRCNNMHEITTLLESIDVVRLSPCAYVKFGGPFRDAVFSPCRCI
ncbi:hypothetical protein V8E55_009581 [Tylopilus felleus]